MKLWPHSEKKGRGFIRENDKSILADHAKQFQEKGSNTLNNEDICRKAVKACIAG